MPKWPPFGFLFADRAELSPKFDLLLTVRLTCATDLRGGGRIVNRGRPFDAAGNIRRTETESRFSGESRKPVRIPSWQIAGRSKIRCITSLRQLRVWSVYGCARIFTVNYIELCEYLRPLV